MANKKVEISVFDINYKSDVRIEYPELADIDEFKDLKVKELKLCWMLGNRTSPIYDMDKKSRLFRALELVYGKNYQYRKDLKSIIDGDIPHEMKVAIKKMESFNPELRLKAKLLSEYMFDTINQMVVLDPESLVHMDIDEKKKYTDLVVKVHEELPKMVKRLEGSYGVKIKEVKTNKEVLVKINDILK
tara:strand:+ start:8598 stop:9161 length:564 start_codon:yes stop_codon:yes gene_type:complete